MTVLLWIAWAIIVLGTVFNLIGLGIQTSLSASKRSITFKGQVAAVPVNIFVCVVVFLAALGY